MSAAPTDEYMYFSSVKLVVVFELEYTGPPIPEHEKTAKIRLNRAQYVDFQALFQTNTRADNWEEDFFTNDLRVAAFVAKNWRVLMRPLPRDFPFKLVGPTDVVYYTKATGGSRVHISAGALPAALDDPAFASKYGLKNYRTELPLLVLLAVAFERLTVDARAVAKRRKRLQKSVDAGVDSGGVAQRAATNDTD